MSQTGSSQLAALEEAIMTRASELAEEFHEKADRQRDTILRESAERLHLAEEREVLVAKAEAERLFRRITQASELKMQGRLDQLRWEMVQTVQSQLADRMRAMSSDRTRYRGWLKKMISEAAERLPEGELTAEANSEDHKWLSTEWAALVAEAAPGRTIHLADTPIWGTGGLKIRTLDKSAQVDNRFEGRLARFEAKVQRAILQRLFPNDINATARSGGPQ